MKLIKESKEFVTDKDTNTNYEIITLNYEFDGNEKWTLCSANPNENKNGYKIVLKTQRVKCKCDKQHNNINDVETICFND